MSFEKQERCIDGLNPKCQVIILASGQIHKDSANQFKAFAKEFQRGTWVAISSPGGNLIAGMQLGIAIRESGFNTTIGNTDFSPPDCLSACAYAFLGGITRKLTPGSRYGLHQFRGTDQEINTADTQKISATLGKYLDVMGVDRRLLDYAQMTSSDKVTILTLAQAQLLKVDTAGQTSYPRWRVEVTPESKLLALNTGLITQTDQIPVTLGILPIPEKKSRLALLVYYKINAPEVFRLPNSHSLQINKEVYPLMLISPWQDKSGGYQASFLLSEEAQQALMQASEDMVIGLRASFGKALKGEQAERPSPSTLITYFGVVNLKNSLQALLGR